MSIFQNFFQYFWTPDMRAQQDVKNATTLGLIEIPVYESHYEARIDVCSDEPTPVNEIDELVETPLDSSKTTFLKASK